LAGATGVIGRRLTLLLRDAGFEVTGTTRSKEKTPWLQSVGVAPVVVDVFAADTVARAVAEARPDVVIHQLTDLASAPGTPGYAAGQAANRRLRIDGTRNLVRAAKMAGACRLIAQSVAFVYGSGVGVLDENDPLDVTAEPPRQLTVQGIAALEQEVLRTAEITGVVLRMAISTAQGPGTTRRQSRHRSMSTPRPMRRCSRSARATGCTTLPRTTAWCRQRRPFVT
jgi:nucleoside-diphosphate-sugar epimerase